MTHTSLGAMLADFASETLRPPERLTVSESAEKYRRLHNPGAYIGPWDNDVAAYLREPMDVLSSREFDSMVFAGPAQSGKTDLFLNWVTHTVICDPMDMILYQTSQTTARDFSRRRLDRLHVHTEEVGKRLLMGTHSDNVFDKQYRSGMLLTLSWPSINELSGRPIPRVWQTDYDRMPQNVDGEGSPFDLGRKRTTTFGAAAMTVAESSPGFIVENPKWIRSTPHEAPPCRGILSLYNRGDRRRWYWQCPHCGHWFEPDFSLLRYDRQTRDATRAGETAMMLCPHPACGVFITPDMKPGLNRAGRWVRDGMRLDTKGRLHGTPFRSKTASFWLKGPAAAFASWATLVSRYVQAEQEFERTGEQEALKSVVNTDLGEPYYLRGSEVHRSADQIKEMAEVVPDVEGPTVPPWVRFLVATVDVQKRKFVVQVTGIGPRKSGFRMTVVDYFDILKSERLDDDGEHMLVSPAAFAEDWRLLRSDVLDKAYPIEGGGAMRVSHMAYDTGGREGVTNNAYDFYRWLRRTGTGEHARVFPLKGDPSTGAPRVAVSYPDSKRKDRHANARGEIPVLMLNPNLLKDGLQGMIDRAAEVSADGKDDEQEGRGERCFTWPDYLNERWYAEVCAEIRTSKGWECPSAARNEAWDCSYYAYALCLHLKVDRMAWDKPATFARPHESNPYVDLPTKAAVQGEVAPKKKAAHVVESGKHEYSPLARLASELA